MVDDLDSDAAGFRFLERAADRRVERRPGILVDFGLQSRLEALVGVVATEEIGVPDEEAFAVIIGVDEPGSDIVEARRAHLAGGWVEDVEAEDLDPHPAIIVMVD